MKTPIVCHKKSDFAKFIRKNKLNRNNCIRVISKKDVEETKGADLFFVTEEAEKKVHLIEIVARMINVLYGSSKGTL